MSFTGTWEHSQPLPEEGTGRLVHFKDGEGKAEDLFGATQVLLVVGSGEKLSHSLPRSLQLRGTPPSASCLRLHPNRPRLPHISQTPFHHVSFLSRGLLPPGAF